MVRLGFPKMIKSSAKSARDDPFFTCGKAVVCYNCDRASCTAGANFIIEREDNRGLSVQSCLKGLGISLLSELDLLTFVHRRGVTLASAGQIACLVGYEIAVVDSALDRLEREKLIERSRPSKGVFLFRFLAPIDAERKRFLQQLISMLESRVGRVLAANQLKSDRPESGSEEGSYRSRK
jgi:DNA-binding MarR family transcriptional regulator